MKLVRDPPTDECIVGYMSGDVDVANYLLHTYAHDAVALMRDCKAAKGEFMQLPHTKEEDEAAKRTHSASVRALKQIRRGKLVRNEYKSRVDPPARYSGFAQQLPGCIRNDVLLKQASLTETELAASSLVDIDQKNAQPTLMYEFFRRLFPTQQLSAVAAYVADPNMYRIEVGRQHGATEDAAALALGKEVLVKAWAYPNLASVRGGANCWHRRYLLQIRAVRWRARLVAMTASDGRPDRELLRSVNRYVEANPKPEKYDLNRFTVGVYYALEHDVLLVACRTYVAAGVQIVLPIHDGAIVKLPLT